MRIKEYMMYLTKNQYSKNTIKTYESVLKIYRNEFIHISRIKNKLKLYFKTPNTAWTHYNILCSYMKWAKDKRLEVMKEIKLPRIPKKYMVVFKKEFLEKKTKINDGDNDELKQKKVTIQFLFETGIRASELYTIQKIDKKTITIIGKGNKIRQVFHNHETTSKLINFTHTTKTLRLWVKEILGSEFTPHSIRRSHATHMLLSGANPKMVMMQLGHEKIETTFRYLNLSIEDNWKIYNKSF